MTVLMEAMETTPSMAEREMTLSKVKLVMIQLKVVQGKTALSVV